MAPDTGPVARAGMENQWLLFGGARYVSRVFFFHLR
jgi:hypothetical protein